MSQHITQKVVNTIIPEITQDKSLTVMHSWCVQEVCCTGAPLKQDYPECVFPAGQCSHHRWDHSSVQRLLQWQCSLCQHAAGIWSQGTAGEPPAFAHPRSSQER